MQPSGPRSLQKGNGLGSAIRSAFVWNVVSTAFAQIALAAIFLLIAGRLTPEVFGLFALAAVLTDLIAGLATSATVDIVVQRQDFTRRTLSTVLWLTLGCGALIATLIVAVSGPYAAAVNAPNVASLLQMMAITILMVPFVIGPTAVMRQRLDFKGLSVVSMASSFIGALAALATAYSPWIEWSLVVQRFVASGVSIVLVTARTRIFPTFEFDASVARRIIGPITKVMAGQGVASSVPRVVDLAMGIFFGTAALGHLRVAAKLSEMALNLLVNPLGQLWVVMLSKARTTGERGHEIFLQLSRLTSLIALPGFLGLALVAHDLIALVLPPIYARAGDFLAVLCALGVFVPLTNPRNAILTVLQKFSALFWFACMDLAVTVAVLYTHHWWGPVGMLSGLGLVSVVLVVVTVPYILGQLHTASKEFVFALTPAYTAAAVMCAGVLVVVPFIGSLGALESIAIKALLGGTIYFTVLGLLFRSTAREVLQTISARTAR